jgi:hypothetical protein
MFEQYNLNNLMRIDTCNSPPNYKFLWLEPIKYYSQVSFDTAYNFPFQIEIDQTTFEFFQCNRKEPLPSITCLKISETFGLLHLKYIGECYEGSRRERIIFYQQKSNGIYSRDLTFDSY